MPLPHEHLVGLLQVLRLRLVELQDVNLSSVYFRVLSAYQGKSWENLKLTTPLLLGSFLPINTFPPYFAFRLRAFTAPGARGFPAVN
jgi:hypothetical protein